MQSLSEATEAYAAYSNALIGYDGDDPNVLAQLHEDYDKAKRALDLAWLEHTTGES
jgi:hypothetical protein